MKVFGLIITRKPIQPPMDTKANLSALLGTLPGTTRWDSQGYRDALWKQLTLRLGSTVVDEWRSDFDGHLADDGTEGVERAYYCLALKLVDAFDIMSAVGAASGLAGGISGVRRKEGAPRTELAVSPFTMYRKIQ